MSYRTYRYLVLCAAAVVFVLGGNAPRARADLIVDAVGDFEYSPGQTNDSVTIRVADAEIGTPDILAGWQLSLQIVADLGATGELTFVDAIEPPDYILDGLGLGLLPTFSTTNYTNDGMLVNDFDIALLTGVTVLASPQNVANIEVEASADASGTFHLLALPGVNQTFYIDDLVANTEIEFDNVTGLGGAFTLGSFTLSAVPEPSSLWLVATSVFLLGNGGRRRNRLI